MTNRTDLDPHAREAIDDSQAVYEATRMIRLGAAALCGLVPEEPHFILTGPGFHLKITRTDPPKPLH